MLHPFYICVPNMFIQKAFIKIDLLLFLCQVLQPVYKYALIRNIFEKSFFIRAILASMNSSHESMTRSNK